MWLLFAFGSAIFAGITAILAKIGIRHTDSTLATAIRTIVVLIFAWIMVWITGAQSGIASLEGKTLLFLVLSGLATGASWLCYFHALQIGDVNKVTPIDKSSTILTMVLAALLLGEGWNWKKTAAALAIGIGTMLMITRKESNQKKEGSAWLIYALLSAVFASLTSILAKVGITGIDSNLGTAVRTTVVLLMAWLMVFVSGKQRELRTVGKRDMTFICLSGLATGASWLCYYRALQIGEAGIVVPIDKLSVVVTIAFSYFFLKEKLSKKACLGLVLIVAGTLLLLR